MGVRLGAGANRTWVSVTEDMGVLLSIKQKDAAAVGRQRRPSKAVPAGSGSSGFDRALARPAGKPSRPGRRPPCSWGEHVWREERAAARPGWWRGWCDACGKFLGYRQGEAPRISGESHPGGAWQ
jgi:hypothetical protein